MRTKIFSLFLILFISFPYVSAQNIPTIKPYVNDFVGVLTQEEINSINSIASNIEKNTTVQVAVLIVNSTQPLSMEDYANRVFRENGIGQRDNNNGLLIVAAISDRAWRIEVGYGLEGTINDAKAGDIGRTYLVPNFQKGDYGLGMLLAVKSIGTIVQGSDDPYLISNQNSYDTLDSFTIFFPWLFIILVIFLPLTFINLSRCPTCKSWAWGKPEGDKTIFVCKKGHRWSKKRKSRFFFFFFPGFGRGGGGGGGGFGGGSSGGGGAGGRW